MWKSQDTERRKDDNRGKEDILKIPRHKCASALLGQEALHGPAVHAGGTQAGAMAQRQAAGHTWEICCGGTTTEKEQEQAGNSPSRLSPPQSHDLRFSPKSRTWEGSPEPVPPQLTLVMEREMPTAGLAHTSPSRLSSRVRAAHGGTETADHHGPHANHTSTFSPTIPYSQRGCLLWDNSHMTELHPGSVQNQGSC